MTKTQHLKTTVVPLSPISQDFGDNPVKQRETDNYAQEYIKGFVDKWDELIDWESRASSEGDFFIRTLKKHGVRKVLDVATGTGFHSVRLLEAGFEVVSADGSPEMLVKAFENARQRGHILRTVQADWRWLNRDVHGEYDAIICLGNSFTHMFDERDRRKALAEYYAMLKHDGILILDQRNYDNILDNGFSTKHTYYYCGDNVKAEPEHVDAGLARFRYDFPDDTSYYLNMFPLRKNYTRRLMQEVGFQKVETYGDFQETYRDEEPDFFVHVAEKSYDSLANSEAANAGEVAEMRDEPSAEADASRDETAIMGQYSAAVETAREYYNSDDADRFYFTIWGGEDIHIGWYESPSDLIAEASRRTVKRMADKIATHLNEKSRVLDMGSGYGGAARYLAKRFGCSIVALNLSEAENERCRCLNAQQGLDDKIEVIDGTFEHVPMGEQSFDLVWSQDAFLHSGNRSRVLDEVSRVLKPGGRFVFTDPMQADDCPDDVLQPILDRIHLSSLGSPEFYRAQGEALNLDLLDFEHATDQLVNHYSRVLQETERRHDDLAKEVSADYLARMKAGLKHWINGGRNGHLAWGIFQFCKP